MKEIIKDGLVLARHITKDDIKDGLNFFSKDEDFIQVGVWGNYEKDKDLKAHIHNVVERTSNRTYETLYIMNGSIEVTIYTLSEEVVDKFDVKQGEILVLLECGHGYRIKEDGTYVLEVKNGPYFGAEIDRRRI